MAATPAALALSEEVHIHDVLYQLAPSQAVDNSATFNVLAVIVLKRLGPVTITGIVSGTGPLTGLKISAAAGRGLTHVDRLTNTDFNTPTSFLLFSTPNPHTTASGGSFQFTVNASGIGELKIYASSSNGASVSLEVGG